MFKKIVLVFLLLVVLAGISYVKTYRERQQLDAAYDEAKSAQTEELTALQHSVDSLNNLLTANKDKYQIELKDQQTGFEQRLDSLEEIISKQEKSLVDLEKKQTQKLANAKKSKPKQLSQHEKIYRYYKKRYTDLPKDLSDYERKIAISEIREETASKFSISLSELNRIRKDYKLSY